MIIYPSSFHVLLSSGLITTIFSETMWAQNKRIFCNDAAEIHIHSLHSYYDMFTVKAQFQPTIFPNNVAIMSDHAEFALFSIALTTFRYK